MFVFICLKLLLLLLSLFSFVFISGQNFISNSKDAAATTAADELIIGIISVLLLLKLKILYYSRELSLRKKCLYSELFWSAFSRIRTEYGEISLRIQSECRKIRTRTTPNLDTLYALYQSNKYLYRAVFNSTLKNFRQWTCLRLEMRLSELFLAKHTK